MKLVFSLHRHLFSVCMTSMTREVQFFTRVPTLIRTGIAKTLPNTLSSWMVTPLIDACLRSDEGFELAKTIASVEVDARKAENCYIASPLASSQWTELWPLKLEGRRVGGVDHIFRTRCW